MTLEDLVATSQGHVHILHHAHVYAMPLSGFMTVDQARAWLEEHIELHPETIAVLDGDEVAGDASVRPGQYLCFVRQSGEMGN